MSIFDALWTFLLAHAYIVVFVGVLVDATGTPFPGRLLLITAGGIAATGEANVLILIGLASAAAVLGDHGWYLAGRLSGDKVIRFYCRVMMLGGTSCVDKAKAYLARFGPAVFVVGRFVAGVRILVAPLAAGSGMPYLRYLVYDAGGALVWASLWITLGFFLGDRLATWTPDGGVSTLGVVMGVGAPTAIGLTIAYRLWHRRRKPAALPASAVGDRGGWPK